MIARIKYRWLTLDLEKRMVLVIVLFSFAMSASLVFIGYLICRDVTMRQRIDYANSTANTIIRHLDGDLIDKYLRTHTTDEEYERDLNFITAFALDGGFEYIYVFRPVENEGCYFIFDSDMNPDTRFKLGDIDPISGDATVTEKYFPTIIHAMKTQTEMPPTYTRDSWGWLLTVYAPIYSRDGTISAYLAVDSQIKGIAYGLTKYLILLVLAALILTAIVITITSYTTRRTIINPLLSMAAAVENMSAESGASDDMHRTLQSIRKLDIRTHDVLQQLADGMKAMARRIESAIEELEQERNYAETVSETKTKFLATMSHEIRTPLNAIIGLSEIQLQRRHPEAVRGDLEKIRNSGALLLGIVNDILDIGKVESGNLELVPVEYTTAGLINDVVQLNLVRIGNKPLTFILGVDETTPSKLFGDEVRVKQVLNNLLSNAIKYTHEGEIGLSVTWEQVGGREALIRFAVRDTGIGIREKDLEKLFSEYSQLDTKTNRRIEGTGLGLFITNKLVTLMHGSMLVLSEYGVGSIFTATLHQYIASEKPIGKETAKKLREFKFESAGKFVMKDMVRSYMPYGRVLAVDDVETNLDVIKGLLLPYGLTVDGVTSGRAAIERIRAGSPKYDIIMMDHMMPGMDGIEATRQIRYEIGTDYAKNVPIIALTANAVTGTEEQFLKAGFNAFISKPVDIQMLDNTLNRWVRDLQPPETLEAAEAMTPANGGATYAHGAGILADAEIDGVDLAEGLRQYAGETAYISVLRSYVTHTPELLEQLRQTMETDLALYAVTVHGLKGSSYGILANSVGKLAEELERLSKAGDAAAVIEKTEQLLTEAARVCAELSELLSDAATEEIRERRAKPDGDKLAVLLAATKRFRHRAMVEALEELEKYDYDDGAELVKSLREAVDAMEYDAITEMLGE